MHTMYGNYSTWSHGENPIRIVIAVLIAVFREVRGAHFLRTT